QNSLVLLTRLLLLKENAPFLLCVDSLLQSSYNFQQEFVYKLPRETKVIYLSFETLIKPKYASEFINCQDLKVSDIVKTVQGCYLTLKDKNEKKLVLIIDSLNYISSENLANFISSLVDPLVTIFATYHSNIPVALDKRNLSYPQPLQLLQFLASSIFELFPIVKNENDDEFLENSISLLQFPMNRCNNKKFKLILTNRRKSGRSLIYNFKIDSTLHTYEIFHNEDHGNEESNNEQELLKHLTTFNLTTSSKQRLAREQVDLPFLEAQKFGSGGAIVYEFEKDDDYDEEDPYEDPF
ncbi:hypothetical protein PACTADRAFT_27177, partial [Pachysolen tannophilus NRRL Y-2460]